ncbi:MAG: hypothetical protein R3C08_03665 [Hyphomonas sp.]
MLSQYEGWQGIFQPETTEWLCGETGRTAVDPFRAAALATYYLFPAWLIVTGMAGLLSWRLARLNGRVVLSLLICGALVWAFMCWGTVWMSDRYEHALQIQCDKYG